MKNSTKVAFVSSVVLVLAGFASAQAVFTAVKVPGSSPNSMISINNGASVGTGVELQETSNGQSMLYVPGIGGPTPSPEPFTMVIGASGIGMFLARRRAAK